MTCVAAPAPPSYVMYKQYATSGCTGTATYTVVYVQDACIESSYDNKKSSITYSCVDNVPYAYYYADSATCTGTASVSPQPTTCSR